MTAKLFYVDTPFGPVLPLAKALAAASPKLGRHSIKIASDLFSGVYPAAEPFILEIEVTEKLPALREACASCGLSVTTDT